MTELIPATTLTCEPWPFDPECCTLPEGDHDALIAKMSAVATDHLWAAGGRVHGTCNVPVRPCLRRCAEMQLGAIPTAPFFPYMDRSGAWHNASLCTCGNECSCNELCEVVLEGPVAGIVEVSFGDVIDPSAYRLDFVGEQARLVRIDGGCWPECQDLRASCGEEGAFCVIYEKGVPLTTSGIMAHSELVCELVKACIPNCKCRVPTNVVRKTRSGLSIEFDVSDSWVRSLPLVDAWLRTVNPNRLMKPLRVMSPDARGLRRTADSGSS